MGSEPKTTDYGYVANHYTEKKLRELCDDKAGIQTGPFGSQLHKEDYVLNGTPIITVEHMAGNRISHKNLPKVSDEDKARLAKYHLATGDLVFSRVGSVDRNALVGKEEDGWLFSGRCLRVRVDKSQIHPNYLSHFFSLEGFKEHIRSVAVGATMPSINTKILSDVPIYFPPLPEQKAIAHILGTLDDKIELNRRMNATLEGMAQALFKSWFVDFGPVVDNALAAGNPIPDELVGRAEVRRQVLSEQKKGTTQQGSVDDSTLSDRKYQFPAAFQFTEELGWIPEGWEVGEIENTTSAIIDHRGKTPKKLGHDWAESGFPAVSAKNIKDGKLVRRDTIKFTDTALYERWMAEELQKGDVLMTSEAPLGEKLYLAKQVKWVLSQRLFALRANDQISGVYLYHWLNTNIAKADIDGRASGTTVQGIRQSELRKVKVLTPDENSIGAFSDTCDALMEKRAINEENTEQLTKLRDTLLPKLISGELRMPEAEQLTEEALA